MKKNNIIRETIEYFSNLYSDKADFISIAPGRINIIGEHTDYNYGLAMPTAIDRYVCVAIRKNNNQLINAHSVSLKESFSVKIGDNSTGKLWHKYVLGIINELSIKHRIDSGLDILIHSNLDMASGLSSSAALELSIANAILYLFNIKISNYEIIKLCQQVEHNHINIKSGILDQSASLLSRRGHLLILNFGNNTHRYIKNNSSESVWVLVDSMIKRKLAHSKYHERVKECGDAIKRLKEISPKKNNFNRINDKELMFLSEIDHTGYKRVKHITDENNRVQMMEKAILSDNLEKIGQILIDSHKSLRDFYEVSCLEIDYLINISLDFQKWFGGRIMGGGFGGNTINLVQKGAEVEYSKYIEKKYLDKFQIIPKIRIVNFSNGAEIINNIRAF